MLFSALTGQLSGLKELSFNMIHVKYSQQKTKTTKVPPTTTPDIKQKQKKWTLVS